LTTKIVCALVVVVVAAAGSPGPQQARAAFPGSPGRIAFALAASGGVGQIYTIAADGSRPRQVTHAPTDALSPSWSADGRRLVLTMGGALSQSGEATKGDLYLIAADETPIRTLTSQPDYWHVTPSWQPLRIRH
jgi:Tol biopolymer transport system component